MERERKEIVLIRTASEVALKKTLARKQFTQKLKLNLIEAFKKQNQKVNIQIKYNYLILHCEDQKIAESIILKVFGVGTFSPVDKISVNDLDVIKNTLLDLYAKGLVGKTFCVRVKRQVLLADRSSTELERELGGVLNRAVPSAKVQLENPDIKIQLEIHGEGTYFYTRRIKGSGGLPLGTQGRAICLMSGGFDSPVAAWKLLKRGVELDYVFCNLAGSAYERLVLQIVIVLHEMWGHGYKPKFYSVPFNAITTEIKEKVDGSFQQVILKRMMYRVAEHIAYRLRAQAIITGEALGQVSSQTLENLNSLTKVLKTQILRPLIGYDKQEIMDLSYYVGTGLLSSKVQEYCSISKGRPVTRASEGVLLKQEAKMNLAVVEKAVDEMQSREVGAISSAELQNNYLYKSELSQGDFIVDLQQSHMYRAWNVQGSHHYDINEFVKGFKKLDKKGRYLIYCTYGTQSPVIAEYMQQMGFEAYAFRGGIAAVKKAAEGLTSEVFMSS